MKICLSALCCLCVLLGYTLHRPNMENVESVRTIIIRPDGTQIVGSKKVSDKNLFLPDSFMIEDDDGNIYDFNPEDIVRMIHSHNSL